MLLLACIAKANLLNKSIAVSRNKKRFDLKASSSGFTLENIRLPSIVVNLKELTVKEHTDAETRSSQRRPVKARYSADVIEARMNGHIVGFDPNVLRKKNAIAGYYARLVSY